MSLKTNLLIITLFPLMFGCSTCFVLFIRYLPITAILMTSPDQRIFSSSPGLMYLTVGGGGNGKDSRNVGLKYLCDTGTGNTISSHPSGGNTTQMCNSVTATNSQHFLLLSTLSSLRIISRVAFSQQSDGIEQSDPL